jgi:hypothetical protein
MAGDMKHAVQVGRHHRLPVVFGHLLEGAIAGNAGTVDENLDRTELIGDRIHRPLAVFVTRDVDWDNRDGEAFAPLSFLPGVGGLLFRRIIASHNDMTQTGQLSTNSGPDTAGSARNQGNALFHPITPSAICCYQRLRF